MSHSGPGVFCFFLSNTNYIQSIRIFTHIYTSTLQFQGEGSNIVNSRLSSGKFVSNLLCLVGSCNIALSIIENQEILSGFHFIILRCMIMVTSRHPEGRLSTIHRDTRLELRVFAQLFLLSATVQDPPPPSIFSQPKLNPEKKDTRVIIFINSVHREIFICEELKM